MKPTTTPTACVYTAPSGARYIFRGPDCWERAEAFKRWVEG